MASNVNRTQYSNAIKTEFENTLLTRAQSRLLHGRWAQKATITERGDYELRKYGSLSAVTTPLSEGVTPSQQSAPSLSVINIDPQYYGAWLRYTRALDLENFDPIVDEMVDILGEQAGLSIDTLVRDDVHSGATQSFIDASSRSDVDTTNDLISYDDFVNEVAELEASDARPLMGGSYVCIIHPYTWAQLMKDSDFITLFTREGGESIRSGFAGRIFNTLIFISSNAKVYSGAGASSIDVYTALFIGREAYGIVGVGSLMPQFDGMDGGGEGFANRTGMSTRPVEIIMKDLGEGGDDPLNQRGTVGWVAAHEESVLNSSWVRSLEHATDQS